MFLHKVCEWLKKVFKAVVHDIAPIAVSVTEIIKDALNNNVVGFITSVLDNITHSQIPTQVIDLLKKELPKILAVELAIEGLPDNPTADDILSFEQRILAAFSVMDNKSKFYSTLAAQVYGLIQNAVASSNGKLTFAQIVALVEQAYQDYLQDLANQQP